MRRARRSAIVAGFVFAGCGRPLGDDECRQLLDRYTERLIASDRRDVTSAEQERIKLKVQSLAARDPEFLRCSERVSRSEFDCAMSAPDVDSMERCLM
jgi:hypothetical protein